MEAAEDISNQSNKTLNLFPIYASAFLLILITHLTNSKLKELLGGLLLQPSFKFLTTASSIILSYGSLLKGLLFLICVAFLSTPLLIDTYRNLHDHELGTLSRPIIIAIGVVLLLGLLIFKPGVDSLGVTYAKMSNNPFTIDTGRYTNRFLMPALAYLLFFRGLWPYYVFSMIATVIFIALLYTWIMDNVPLPDWQFISLCTCSFVIFQFQYAGYPDIFVFICFILIMRSDISTRSKLSLLLLALLAHESSLFIGVILAWRYLQRRESIVYLFALIVYAIIWAAVYGFNINTLLASHNVSGMSGFQWFLHSPLQEILGVFIAFKALWAILILAIWLALRQRLFQEAAFITSLVGAGLVMSILGVDTSRLMGFAFPGLLIALLVINRTLPEKLCKWILAVSFMINLIIPSIGVSLNLGIEFFPGLYGGLYHWIKSLRQI